MSGVEVRALADVALQGLEKVGVALIQPIAEPMDTDPDGEADQGVLKPKHQHSGQGSVQHGNCSGNASHGHWFSERTVKSDFEALDS